MTVVCVCVGGVYVYMTVVCVCVGGGGVYVYYTPSSLVSQRVVQPAAVGRPLRTEGCLQY